MFFKIKLPYQKKECYIQTTENDIINFVINYYGRYCSPTNTAEDFLILLYKQDDKYVVETCDGICKTFYPQKIIVDIINKAGGIYDEYILLHGMSVAIAEQAYVFLAHTHSGKSTLAALLLSRGFQVLSEDAVLIEKQTGCLIPLSMPIRLREGGKQVLSHSLKEDLSLNAITDGKEKRYLIVLDEPKRLKYEIKSIIFSRYSEKNDYRALKLGIDRFNALLSASMTTQIFDASTISTLNRLSKIDTYTMDYVDEQYVIDCLGGNFK